MEVGAYLSQKLFSQFRFSILFYFIYLVLHTYKPSFPQVKYMSQFFNSKCLSMDYGEPTKVKCYLLVNSHVMCIAFVQRDISRRLTIPLSSCKIIYMLLVWAVFSFFGTFTKHLLDVLLKFLVVPILCNFSFLLCGFCGRK